MAEHTPGPWTVNPWQARVDCGVIDPDGDLLPVCQMLWPTDYRSEPETLANALLIAAAPDLLAAAKRSLQGWDNAIELAIILPQHRNTATILADELRAAIAKATGQQEG